MCLCNCHCLYYSCTYVLHLPIYLFNSYSFITDFFIRLYIIKLPVYLFTTVLFVAIIILIPQEAFNSYPNLSIEDNVTPAQHANNYALSPAVGQVLTYELAVWAAAYAISISSHDAVMVDYWDDLEQYGYEQSFEKNIGMSFDEFYQSFNEFRQKTIDEQMTVVSGQINN